MERKMNKLETKKTIRSKFFGKKYRPSDDKLINYYELNLGHIIYQIVPTMYSFHFGVWTSSDRKEKGYIVTVSDKVTKEDYLESYDRSFSEVKKWLFNKVAQ